MVLAAGLLNGAIILFLFSVKKVKHQAFVVLMVFLLLLLLRLLVYLLGREHVYDPHSWLYVPPIELSFSYGPFLYLSITYYLIRHWQWRDLLHFVPVAFQIIYYASCLVLPYETAQSMLINWHLPIFGKLENTLVVLSLFVYLYLSWTHFIRYQKWIDNTRSDAENFRLQFLKNLLSVATTFALVWAVYSMQIWWQELSAERHFAVFAAQSIFITLLAFEVYRHKSLPVAELGVHLNSDIQKDKTNYANVHKANSWLSIVEKERLWKDPELSLVKLAKHLGTNSTALSQSINRHWGDNFNNVINKMRVEYVCNQMETQTDTPLITLAYDAGFNSKNSFNRNFRKVTNVSPSEYRQKISPKSLNTQ